MSGSGCGTSRYEPYQSSFLLNMLERVLSSLKYFKTHLAVTSGLDHRPSQGEGGGRGEEPPG